MLNDEDRGSTMRTAPALDISTALKEDTLLRNNSTIYIGAARQYSLR